jgi:hypothetical protein
MVAQRSYLESGTGCRWLMPAAEMADLASNWRPSPDPALAGRGVAPLVATRAFGADPGSVRTARDFTVVTLHRWGIAERSPDIAIVVSELMTNALRHALPGPAIPGPGSRSGSACSSPGPACSARSPTRARPLRRHERPAPSTRPAADCTSSARSATNGATPRPARPERSCGPCSPHGTHRLPRPGTRAGQAATRCWEQHADDRDQHRPARSARPGPAWRTRLRDPQPARKRCHGRMGIGRPGRRSARPDPARTGSKLVPSAREI